jgi:ATP-dependent Clp protease adapter protein ClpS
MEDDGAMKPGSMTPAAQPNPHILPEERFEHFRGEGDPPACPDCGGYPSHDGANVIGGEYCEHPVHDRPPCPSCGGDHHPDDVCEWIAGHRADVPRRPVPRPPPPWRENPSGEKPCPYRCQGTLEGYVYSDASGRPVVNCYVCGREHVVPEDWRRNPSNDDDYLEAWAQTQHWLRRLAKEGPRHGNTAISFAVDRCRGELNEWPPWGKHAATNPFPFPQQGGGLGSSHCVTYRGLDQQGRDLPEKILYCGSHDECFRFLHKHQGQSVDWALRHGGYSIQPAPWAMNPEPMGSWGTLQHWTDPGNHCVIGPDGRSVLYCGSLSDCARFVRSQGLIGKSSIRPEGWVNLNPRKTQAQKLLKKAIRPCMTRREAHSAAKSIERSLRNIERGSVISASRKKGILTLLWSARSATKPVNRIKYLQQADHLMQQLKARGPVARSMPAPRDPDAKDPRLGHLFHGTDWRPNPRRRRKVHPLAFAARDRYLEDLEAGHKDAAEYWRGQAGAFFTVKYNPARRNPAQVYLHNNDYTPAQVVMLILQKVFGMSGAEARDLAMKIHESGRGLVAEYPDLGQAHAAVAQAEMIDQTLRERMQDPVKASKLAALGVPPWEGPLRFSVTDVAPLDPGIRWELNPPEHAFVINTTYGPRTMRLDVELMPDGEYMWTITSDGEDGFMLFFDRPEDITAFVSALSDANKEGLARIASQNPPWNVHPGAFRRRVRANPFALCPIC